MEILRWACEWEARFLQARIRRDVLRWRREPEASRQALRLENRAWLACLVPSLDKVYRGAMADLEAALRVDAPGLEIILVQA